MTDQWWSWALTFVGLAGFFLAGKKVWWCWYVNIANQILWFTYAFVTEQWGFLVGVFAYLFVFIKNAYEWTKEHYEADEPTSCKTVGMIDYIREDYSGVYAVTYPNANCHGDWDMASKHVHPSCKVVGIPHEPHYVEE